MVTLDLEQYAALISLARQGSSAPDQKRVLERFLRAIDTANNLTRYGLWLQWQEQDASLPAGTSFPDAWPPELRAYLERTDRPVAKSDVLKVLSSKAKNPTEVLVTKDPGGTVGWAKIDDYFRT
jgi:hypothetical protein